MYDKGLRLEKSEYNKWSAIVAIPSDEIATFEYKYVADGKYEDGPNRRQFFSSSPPPLFFCCIHRRCDVPAVDAMSECLYYMLLAKALC